MGENLSCLLPTVYLKLIHKIILDVILYHCVLGDRRISASNCVLRTLNWNWSLEITHMEGILFWTYLWQMPKAKHLN